MKENRKEMAATGAASKYNTGAPYTPAELARRWGWHPESVRRKLRLRHFASIVISRRRLIPASEVDRIEQEGFLSRGF